MYCPRDDFGLTTKVLSGSDVHQCTSCHGLWISKGSILALAEATHIPSLAQHVMNEKAPEHFELGALKCPADGTQMQFRSMGQVEVDICPSCHGVWLDRGELENLASQTSLQPARSHMVGNALDALIYLPGTLDATAIDTAANTLGEVANTLGATAAETGAALVEAASNNMDGIGDILSALIGAIAEALN